MYVSDVLTSCPLGSGIAEMYDSFIKLLWKALYYSPEVSKNFYFSTSVFLSLYSCGHLSFVFSVVGTEA